MAKPPPLSEDEDSDCRTVRFYWLVSRVAAQTGDEHEAERLVVEWLGPESRLVQSW